MIDDCRSASPVQVARLESLIRMLYDVEGQIKDLDGALRLARRESSSCYVRDFISRCFGIEKGSVFAGENEINPSPIGLRLQRF